MLWFVIFWAVFSLVAFIAFAVVETLALVRKLKGDTYSESIRAFFHTDTVLGKIIWTLLWLPFAISFWGHIAFGWPLV